MSGWHTTMWVGVALTAAAFLFVLVRGPRAATVTNAAAEDDEMHAFPLPIAEAELDGIAS